MPVLIGLALLVGSVHYLVVHGTNLNALFAALGPTLFLAMVCRGYWTGLFSGPTGLRCRTLTRTRDFAWEEIAGFELRPRKWRAVTVSGIVIVTTAGEAVNTEFIVGPNGRQPSMGLYSEAELIDLMVELEAQRSAS
ncbi:PH domain-containing protein [Amycolatopsis magusensis]|uniref:PH domain-containing protein n=1 Tax=Amycolatopsis magusensis TaxID=882444 RepID=UPI003C2BC39F